MNAPDPGAPSPEEAPARRLRWAQIGIALFPNHGDTPEDLLRWPRAGAPDMVASPGIFVLMAEGSSMIHELGEWVITETLRDMVRLEALTGPRCLQRVVLNISPVQFLQPDFVGALATRLLADGIDAPADRALR